MNTGLASMALSQEIRVKLAWFPGRVKFYPTLDGIGKVKTWKYQLESISVKNGTK